MRLVDGEERDAHRTQPLSRRAGVKPLGRNVEQLDVAPRCAGETIGNLCPGERAVDECRGKPTRGERVDLVLHERDERRHDDGEPRQHQRRHLIAERLAAACGEDDQRVTTAQDRRDRALLPRTKSRVTERLAQRGAGLLQQQLGGNLVGHVEQ